MGDGGGGHWLVRMEWHPAIWSVSASVNLPLHHKVQKFFSGTGSPGWSQKKGRKGSIMKSCICRGCLNPVTSTGRTSVDITASANLELVDMFCYLGDMLSVDGDADAALEARIRIGWINSATGFIIYQYGYIIDSLIRRGRLYSSCV